MASEAKRISNHGDQRTRLLRAIVEVVALEGYARARIGDLARRAGVSRATFYELFANKEECLLDAQRALAERVSGELAQVVARGESSRALQSTLSALLEFAEREPLVFDFLMHEAMLGGPEALAVRDQFVSSLELTIERSWEQAPDTEPVLDMPPRILLEGAVRLLRLRMRREEKLPRRLLGDLLTWIDSYTVNPGPRRWRTLSPHPALLRASPQNAGAAALHRSLPRGRHRLGAGVVRSVQRERIAYATAEAIRVKGYANITVADIVATAGLSRDVFYAHFHDTQQAFEETVQLVFEQLMAKMAGAFFGCSGDWPEQAWEAINALVQFLEDNPSLAHFLFVGTYAPPPYIERVHDFVLAFTVFVEYGARYSTQPGQVPRVSSEAIVCALLELLTFHIRHNRVHELWGLIPVMTYTVLVPFMGTDRAYEFVEAKINAAQIDAAASLPS
jgi:AcrR family transcriptional regulator